MSEKENILDAWIMVEHLSEGNINLRDKTIFSFNELYDGDYYSFFMSKMRQAGISEKTENGGVILYLGVFPFGEIIDFLRKKYKLKQTDADVVRSDKFSMALYFDNLLELDIENTFASSSYYIRCKKDIPTINELEEFEKQKRDYIEEEFRIPEIVDENFDYPAFFNKAISSVIESEQIDIGQCRYSVLKNIEYNVINLHSFFIRDLEKAKKIDARNLDDYIGGKSGKRFNLDTRKSFPESNLKLFRDILEPKNYPLGRFPSNINHALALMQQVAVNLAIGYDDNQIRSVNGPPGTGKTSLLKDVIADLIVEQALEIVWLQDKKINGTEETIYWDNASIGVPPVEIVQKEVIVASSNNGAVKNIVDELPMKSEIDTEFIEALIKADYFYELSNSILRTKWEQDDNGKKFETLVKIPKEENNCWGLFSLEGGRKENVEKIITALKHMANELENNYILNEDIYDSFKSEYDALKRYRDGRQTLLEETEKLKVLTEKLNELSQENEICKSRLSESRTQKELINQAIIALQLQKPGFFSCPKRKREYKNKLRDYSEELQELIIQEKKFCNENNRLNEEINNITNKLFDAEKVAGKLKVEYDYSDNDLDFTLEYDELQLSNPWFDIEYRRKQSLLFISALKVRKQFLYENVKNLKAAYVIWNKQLNENYSSLIISAAWGWINFAIPVISSTFASFYRMYQKLGPETMGYLFIDEAGQAVPQASVGALYRCKNAMVVGDPAQIKPVLTLDPPVLSLIRERYNVDRKYISEDSSTQTLVDEISQYGFYKETGEENWIGIPLWVHRRCKSPMFDIANKISYGNNMVQGIDKKGKCVWYDVPGIAKDKYVAEQGVFIRDIISQMITINPDIIDTNKKDIIFVITPFRNVANQLSRVLKEIHFTRYGEDGKPTNIGTVHTFQGKEASIVFLVLGADEKSKGAANWAVGSNNPNIMNVAATRAKDEFYIIGDRKLYMSLNSSVIDDTYRFTRLITYGKELGQEGNKYENNISNE